jgi:hypothetical protein
MAIVEAGLAPEDSELADVIDRLGKPAAITRADVIAADPDIYDQDPQSFGRWLRDRKNGRTIPHRFAQCGYVKVPNAGATDGQWRIAGVRQAIYSPKGLTLRDQLAAAKRLIKVKEAEAAAARKASTGDGFSQKLRTSTRR